MCCTFPPDRWIEETSALHSSGLYYIAAGSLAFKPHSKPKSILYRSTEARSLFIVNYIFTMI